MRRAILAYLPAVLIAYAVASVLATQVILAKIRSLGMPLTLHDHLRSSGHDLVGLASSYLPLMLLAFALALPVAVWLGTRFPRHAAALYALAGFVAAAPSASISASAIEAPRRAHSIAKERPMPEAPPVITIVLPATSTSYGPYS